ncbi:MAG: alpha/beta hydrolase [Coriobacteriia bacterium]|nr:alpha/beta hydrolase [Coriobacteriia bacterium]
MTTLLKTIWADWRLGLVVTVVIAAAAALPSAALMPRGPATQAHALVAIAVALVTGLVAGAASGNRWSIALTPLAFAVTFELARLGTSGPTVDRLDLGSTYGVIAFVVGRGVHGLLVLIPLMVGAAWGVRLAARLGHAASTSPVGLGLAGLGTLALVALTVMVAWPARTAPVMGPNATPLEAGVAEITQVAIGGHDQTIMIRGRSADSPVILYLAGGPGGTDLGAMRADVTLEQDFVVVTWDQRGAGKSYQALEPVETLTLEQMIADTIELTEYLRERFEERRIYLVGNSWGTILGALAAEQRPDLYHAVIGTGQMVSPRETDIMFYEDTVTWAEHTGRDELLSALLEVGPPPYDDLLDYELALSHEHEWNPYPELDAGKEMPGNLFVPENTFIDRVNGLRGFLDTFAVLYPQIQDVDLRNDVPRLDVPVTVVLGAHEARGRAVLAREWFEMLDAPSKDLVVFEHSGHRPLFEEPGEFARIMATVRDATYERP